MNYFSLQKLFFAHVLRITTTTFLTFSHSYSVLTHFFFFFFFDNLFRNQALAFLSYLLDSSYTSALDDLDTPQLALGPVFDAVSDWILEPNKQHVEPEEVVTDRENSKNRDRDRNSQQQSGSGIYRNDREDMRGRNEREGGGGNKEETRGLAGYFFSAIYNAGASLFTGDFAALSLGLDAEDDTQVFIYLFLFSILHSKAL